jgi:polar amino acid transport system substrate-binding protein
MNFHRRSPNLPAVQWRNIVSRCGFIALIVCGVLPAHSADPPANQRSVEKNSQKPLVVCAVPDSMPRTGKAADGSGEGLDIAVARLVAGELGRPLEIHWCVSAACSWKCIGEKRCEMVIGQPHGSGPAREVAWSIPYSGSRFGLVVHQDTQGIRSSADLSGKRVGLVAGSVALSSQGHTAVEFKSRETLLEEFVASRLDAAFVDDDFAAWYLHAHPQLTLVRVAEYVPRERWNMAVAVRAADGSLLKAINRALTSVVLNGKVNKAFAEQGVTFRAPFTNSEGKPVAGNSWKRIREHGEIVVSFDPANLPYSSATEEQPGCDTELARALAEALGVKLRIDWIDIHRKTAMGQLLDGECDLAFGSAIEPRAMDDEEEIGERVIYSRPYYGTGYFLVTRKTGPEAKSLEELKGEKSRRLGTEAGSVADYELRQRGYLRRLFRTQLAVLKSLSDGGIDYAYLWANVGWTLHASPEFALQIAPSYVPKDHWNIAVAMRRGDDELKQHVDEALQKLIDDGTVSRTLAKYHLPYFPPFENAKESAAAGDADSAKVAGGHRPIGWSRVPSASSGELQANGSRSVPATDAVIRHPPPDRGIEPQMQRRQRSKQRYSGLERIRSAGVLVVGLDHNALPFSTAHPGPAGLDYEIAGLLAEKLGVSLNVFWGYSSHDSYPSKLATKELCDVMLGVMPDDRFGKRVTFSKPYYFADYRLVVAAGGKSPEEKSPLAAEHGLALRGIRGRELHEYPSLENILAAVAAGKEPAGYVSATRGSWLAVERWPGELHFIRPPSDAVDRFPICAVVRKSDDDLKTAIDEAFEELARSGKLAQVFARWHIPYEDSES